ncbi:MULTISPECIES: three-helix bundle dimerization domain-containing protein [Mycobacterium]|uniref:Uncharacterized protein n=1 Tax=Mycobacterium kiyosense TaxID=2871094 RepID=A0A9P3Q9W3_9MYCO|nr:MULTISPECIES: hypothetical protein [Mycobacterium]BDB45366.1 hypothetical protein IWGMT90018_58120 [Mycobacterium kiyosense]BDE16830.1 hypothetical protein MKCMC460_56900 [Mycobacterium sp. 20KCMC460]GLB83086.1 hypothetical protein SRL2020028_23420 [Mycobacterium kiyosense]GLB90693.1 hypothetical protein SRL2020130_35100 [Mycobacterium kiyosense]GLB97404.1 hypothetical protein SRL2020226_41800 [Mycobacterium kiyosense]
MIETAEERLIIQVERRLTASYRHLRREQIAVAVRSAHAAFDRSPIRDFIPLLVERRARAELAQTASLNRT